MHSSSTIRSVQTRRPPPALWPALAVAVNALAWGLSWWPLRQLQGMGLHPLWATVLIYLLAVLLILALRPAALRQLVQSPALWVLLLASGVTNASFNWAVVIGDVVRVVLLFYLMPLWAVLLAWLLLGEVLTIATALRVLLALGGAVVVLWPEQGGWPLPTNLADVLGITGGFAFALNNVMLRREADRPDEGRALAMFAGAMLVAGALASVLTLKTLIPAPPHVAPTWVLGTLVLSLLLLVSNLSLQYGASRLPANVTAVVMLAEVFVAAISAVWLGGGVLTLQLVAGGALIVVAASMAALERQSTSHV